MPIGERGFFATIICCPSAKTFHFLMICPFMTARNHHAQTDIERNIIGRTAVLVWAARSGLRRDGDFVEYECYRGPSARMMCDASVAQRDAERDWFGTRGYDVLELPTSQDFIIRQGQWPRNGAGLRTFVPDDLRKSWLAEGGASRLTSASSRKLSIIYDSLRRQKDLT